MLKSLYQKVLGYAAHPRATPILCLVAFIEASFFPIPPDLFLVSMGLAKPKKAITLAMYTTFFSVLGGLAGYAIGKYLWDGLDGFFFEYLIHPDKFEKVRILYENNAFSAIFLSGYTPIPYKIFTISAGVFDISHKTFLTASILGRSMRFFLFAGTIYIYGDRASKWVEDHIQTLLTISSLILIAAFIAFKVYF